MSKNTFAGCILDCNLLDLGFSGPPFTWKSGQLLERLDRVLCNPAWQNLFPETSITHLPLPTSDHCGLWLRPIRSDRRQGYFKFLGPWLDHPTFKTEVANSWHSTDSWCTNLIRTTYNLSLWNKEVFGNIFRRKHRILKRLEGINRVLMKNSIERLLILKDQLWLEYQSIVKYEEAYWFHQAKCKWISLGDLNNKFFHMSAVQKRRRNKVSALQTANEQWIYEEQEIKNLVIDFFFVLYSSCRIENYSFITVNSFPPIRAADLAFLASEVTL